MKRYPLFLLLPVLLLAACRSEPAEAPAEEATPETAAGYDVFGESFDDAEAIPVETVAADPEAYVGKTVKMAGRVSEVCQAMGCWLTLQVPNGDNVRIVVPRDEDGDYVFTVAKDISGRRAVVQGTLDGEVLSAHEQHHYAEDAHEGDRDRHTDGDERHEAHEGEHEMHTDGEGEHGDHAAEAAPKPELQLTASGVLVEVRGP